MIYIKTNMTEMPKSCQECEVCAKSRFDNSQVCRKTGESTTHYQTERPLWCPLVEIKENENDK